MAGVRVLLLNDIFLSLNSLNSVKTFRKNSNVVDLIETKLVFSKIRKSSSN